MSRKIKDLKDLYKSCPFCGYPFEKHCKNCEHYIRVGTKYKTWRECDLLLIMAENYIESAQPITPKKNDVCYLWKRKLERGE